MNFSFSFKEYLSQEKNPVSKVTIKNYLSDARKFVAWFEEKFQRPFNPNLITQEVALEYIEESNKSSNSLRSAKRYQASLKKFFGFLLEKRLVRFNPFNLYRPPVEAKDPWSMKAFGNFLYTSNASSITMKNYISDVLQFLNWAAVVNGFRTDRQLSKFEIESLFSKINTGLIEEYKKRLLTQGQFSPLSVNRKLSALRKYISFAKGQNIIKGNIDVDNAATFSKLKEEETVTQLTPSANNTTSDLELLLNELPEKQTEEEIKPKKYSRFGPLRFLQKSKFIITGVSDLLIIASIIKAIEAIKYKLWVSTGKEIFKPIPQIIGSKTSIPPVPKIKSKPEALTTLDKFISLGKPDDSIKPQQIKSIPKSVYAPLQISTKPLSFTEKITHTLRYYRPNWYRRYHQIRAVHYIHFGILIIFITFMGVRIFQSSNAPQQERSVLSSHVAPNRQIAFRGTLYDEFNTPITQESKVKFAIYNSQSSQTPLWQETQLITPDPSGKFSTTLGKINNLSQDIFTDNPSLYLGIAIGSSPELFPREQLANSSLTKDSETLQGLVPITENNTNSANVILALDSSGNLTIGGNSSPIFQAIGGDFKLSGQSLTLASNDGSNGNVVINPDGTGIIDLQKPIQNTSNNGNIPSALGAVEIDDTLAVQASGSAESALVISQNGPGDIISGLSGGVAKFTVDENGSGTFGQDLNILGNNLNTVAGTFNLANTNTTTLNIGGAATTLSLAATSGTTTINNNLKVAANLTLPTLSSGSITYIDTSKNLAQDNSNLFWDQNNKRLGIGTNSPSYRLSVLDNLSSANTAAAAITNSNTTDSTNTVTLRLNTGVASSGTQARFVTFYAGVTSGDTGGAAVGNIGLNGSGVNYNTSGADYAEYFAADDSSLSQGEVVGLDGNGKAVKATGSTPLVGVVSTTAGFTGNDSSNQETNNKVVVGLMGQLPVKVSGENGSIKIGDPLTSSSTPGVAMKAIKSSQVIGRAMENYDPATSTNNLIKISLNVSWYAPNAVLMDNGVLATAYATPVSNSTGNQSQNIENLIPSVQSFLNTLADGVLEVKNISTDSLVVTTDNVMIGGKTLKDYISGIVEDIVDKKLAEKNNQKIVILSPIVNATDDSSSSQSATLTASPSTEPTTTPTSNITNITNVYNIASPSATPSPSVTPSPSPSADGNENASQSADLNSTLTPAASTSANIDNQITPTPSPDLTNELANNHQNPTIANNINLSSLITPPSDFKPAQVASFSAELYYVPNLKSDFLTATEGFIALGPSSLADTSINGNLSIENNLKIDQSSINTFQTDLSLQPLRQGNLSIMGGLVAIDTQGNLTVNGNAQFAKDVNVKGTLSAGIISPVADSDLVVKLGNQNDQKQTNHNFTIQDATGSAKFNINTFGDLIASGAATFQNIKIVRGAQADTSLTETVASGSAGAAVISAYETERTIFTPFVTKDSLIYITPISQTFGQNPYVARQTPEDPDSGTKGSFTIQIPQTQREDIKLNWWIIN